MPTTTARAHSHEAPRPLSSGEIGRRLDDLRDELSAAEAGVRPGAPFPVAPADLLRRLASLTSRN
jgi:hypothetical protein